MATNYIELQQEAIVSRRRVLRRAYDLVRSDPQKRVMMDDLAKCLGGSITRDSDLYEQLYERACEMCAADDHYELVVQAEEANQAAKRAELSRRRRRARQMIQRAQQDIL